MPRPKRRVRCAGPVRDQRTSDAGKRRAEADIAGNGDIDVLQALARDTGIHFVTITAHYLGFAIQPSVLRRLLEACGGHLPPLPGRYCGKERS